MNNGFWDKLFVSGKPVIGLSPMDGVTDAPMRYMSARYGSREISNPKFSNSQIGGIDLLFTEFVSVDALHYATGERRERLLKTFIKARDVGEKIANQKFSNSQMGGGLWPYEIAQVFGHTPSYFAEAAKLVESLGFDGIDINMGCPMHKVEDQGSGAGLIRTPELAKEIVRAVRESTSLPVSVKTRIGVDKDIAEEWMEHLMEVSPANITLHGRTLRQLYQGSADWEAIGRAASVVHGHGGHLLGNGDVLSLQDGLDKVEKYSADGFLIGRAAEGNPGIFSQSQIINSQILKLEPTVGQRLEWMVEHAEVYESIFKPEIELAGDVRWFMPMRKHLAWYCKGFEGAVEMRSRLMLTNSVAEVKNVISGSEKVDLAVL